MRKLPSLTTLVRWLLGLQLAVNGLNWWEKLLPFPSVSDPPATPMKHAVVGAMLETGWMFPLSKFIELLTGTALLLDVLVPLMLVVAFPVVLSAFLFDAFIFTAIAGWLAGTVKTGTVVAKVLDMIFFGGAVLAMHVYLMLTYFPYYRPLLAVRARSVVTRAEPGGRATEVPEIALRLLGWLALVLGVISTSWIVGMVRQWAVPWGSLSVLAS